MVMLCCVCNRQKQEKDELVKWVEKTTQEIMVSHGYCPECAAAAMKQITEVLKEETWLN